jgi:hypothetical protein
MSGRLDGNSSSIRQTFLYVFLEAGLGFFEQGVDKKIHHPVRGVPGWFCSGRQEAKEIRRGKREQYILILEFLRCSARRQISPRENM